MQLPHRVTVWQKDLGCSLNHIWKNNPKLTKTWEFHIAKNSQGLPVFRTVSIQIELSVARASVWLMSRLVETWQTL